MKIARRAIEQYNGIDPREIDIDSVVKRIDYEYVPMLWVYFFLGATCATVIMFILFVLL